MTGIVPDQVVECVLCGGQSRHYFSAHDALGTTNRQFSILHCADCGLFSLSPSPTPQEMPGFYPSDYQPFRSMLGAQLNPWQRWLEGRHWQLRRRAVERFHDGGALLDVGCGTGEFLDVMRRTGRWQVMGAEVDEGAVAHSRVELGLVVHQGDPSTLDQPSDTWDVVTMWHVLEHLPDPLAALRAIARLLKPEGVLLLSTPNPEAWQARLWQRWWCGWDVPRHRYLFTASALERLLACTGFRVIERLRLPAERFFLIESCNRRLDSLLNGHALRRPCQRLAAAASVMLWPALRLVELTNSSSHVTVAAVPLDQPPAGSGRCQPTDLPGG